MKDKHFKEPVVQRKRDSKAQAKIQKQNSSKGGFVTPEKASINLESISHNGDNSLFVYARTRGRTRELNKLKLSEYVSQVSTKSKPKR